MKSDWTKMTRVKVVPSGLINWSISGQFVTRCSVNMAQFPFDTQTCEIKVGPFSLPTMYINVTVGRRSFDQGIYTASEEFDLIGNSTEYRLDGDPKQPFSTAVFKMKLRRRYGYYVVNVILPCCLLAVLSLITFCLPINSGERVSLQITVLLSQSVYQLILTNYVPVTSMHMPVLSE